ncbi:putative sugar kinase [Trachipleistophora hominis]|uniref:ATP-dependent (S)-NAD(P)H-hydrate dehydratase n=1 Tax=Trachipleistophora hominis TaxID=72359 RepID=L7JVX3_TRAHO|nr:putative sugar kinase [Trachipleistophora hominis]
MEPKNHEICKLSKNYKIPKKCTKTDYKTSSGVLLLIGGCDLYVGAPCYVSKAAYATGIDLCYILCDGCALIPLKTLLPECIILSFDQFELEKHTFILERVTCCVLGSGLGRLNERVEAVISELIGRIRVPLIVDGDGLYLWDKMNFTYFDTVIFTPNRNESEKYLKNVDLKKDIVLKKGPVDIITYVDSKITINSNSGLRRCGGIGDVLCGVLASLVNVYEDKMLACKYASLIVRKASYAVYKKMGRSTMPTNIISEICAMRL